MRMVLAAGSVVLNQDSNHPMCGTVAETGEEHWCDGTTSHENPSDVTLTGACQFEARYEDGDTDWDRVRRAATEDIQDD